MKGEHTLDDIPISLYTTSETRTIHWRKEREKEKERTGERERERRVHTHTHKCISASPMARIRIFSSPVRPPPQLPIQQQDDCFSGALFLFDMSTVSGK